LLTGTPKRLELPQMRMSQTVAISSPPPTQAPSITASVGCLLVAIACIARCVTSA
jgi:hypothetical protein